MSLHVDYIVAHLYATHFNYVDEDQLQQGIAAALEDACIDAVREVRLPGAGRIDFLCEGGVGIEVKVAGSVRELERQAVRYLEHEHLTALVVVTDRVRHGRLPPDVDGKPLRVVSLVGRGL